MGLKASRSAWRPAFEKLNDQINHIKVSYKNRNQILKRTPRRRPRDRHSRLERDGSIEKKRDRVQPWLGITMLILKLMLILIVVRPV